MSENDLFRSRRSSMRPTCTVWPDKSFLFLRSIRDPHQTRRIFERQRPNQKRVQHAEHGGTGTNTKPDDQNGERGESGVAPQRAKGVAKVLQQAFHCGATSAGIILVGLF